MIRNLSAMPAWNLPFVTICDKLPFVTADGHGDAIINGVTCRKAPTHYTLPDGGEVAGSMGAAVGRTWSGPESRGAVDWAVDW
jgi:hypothetical protein